MNKIKNNLIRKTFASVKILALGAMLFAGAGMVKAQACGGTANIPPNGTFSVNGITVTSASTGFVSTFAATYSSCGVDSFSNNSLLVGSSSGGSATWQTALTFSYPVNDIVVLISATEAGENFRFVSNGGTISITALNSCSTSISGNTITGTGTLPPYGGGGRFRIHAPAPFTTLTMNGGGGTSGALLAICSTSIVTTCKAGTTAPALSGNGS
ncbi:hypothetical protein OF897_15125 [Chryseobacterium formosus]|uniref:Uncharacterized protein n=1 Tax=Chryseobacterium formosus TaxID=1537363 RepID=A0ABT3XUB7_9FLAO|nr:hypothetical protein [Chryseobacterium formosus]MCX8525251.1 hypothetical protein [Chryseobacterium formosus]